VVRNLRPAAVNLAQATPDLGRVFTVLNHLLNMIGYNPGNVEHGYLWWLAWLNHNARTLFSVQDANGDYRPLFLQASCATLAQIANSLPGGSALLNLLPILSNLNLCPKQAADIATHAGDYAPAVARAAKDTSLRPGAGIPILPKLPTN
jgi:hypothetical protein